MPTPREQPADAPPEAQRIHAQAIVDLEHGCALDLAALCQAHPAHATGLRRVHEVWQQLNAELRGQRTLADRLESRYGEGADPRVSLQGAAEPTSDFSSEVMARLSGRQPSSSRYKLEGEVARGGMGAILRVWDEDLRRHLAMKVVLGKGESGEKSGSPEVPTSTLARFLEEAQVTGQLDHPGIVPVHELGLDADGQVYFTMKLVKGVTLKAVFDELAAGEGGWTQTRVLGLILRVCEAMAYAHDKQVIHRDLKPANVMVGKFGEVYVMDWGLAKILGSKDRKDLRLQPATSLLTSELRSDRRDLAGQTPDSPLFTMDGDVVGTPAYMSPEQAAGRVDEMGPPSDVFAIGAMIYHLLAGHMPYVPPGARLNNYAVWSHVQAGPPRALREVAPLAPPELVAICEKAMARDAKARYANTSELAADLAAYTEGRVVRAYETGAWAEARKWVQRNRPLAAALAAALVLAVGGLASTSIVQARGRAAERVQRDRAEAETAKVLRLSDARVLQDLESEVDVLWPAYPARIPELESWVERARKLSSSLTAHRANLAEMREKAHAWSAADRASDRASHPRAAELAALQAELEGLIAQLEGGAGSGAQEDAEARLVALEAQVAALQADVDSRRTWRFETPEDTWQHGVLAALVADLERLESGLLAQEATTPDHGWSVTRRLAMARELERGFAAGGAHAAAWARAIPSIRAAYPGLDLKPQMGLVPLGPDPDSGLWEFAHLMTGAPAERGGDGRLVLTEGTGVVLVLVGGGSFWMGAQGRDPEQRNYDPQASVNEGPVHQVGLDAYFLAKYEMTQGQWLRLTGSNPSNYQQDSFAPTLLHPVEQVSWQDCMEWLPRAGLALPSEAQWEYAARAGTDSPWWTGTQRESLMERRAANLADQAGARAGATWAAIDDWPELDDGFAVHAPAGTYSANGFGLHEIVGNLWEWCLDGYDDSFYAAGPRANPVTPWAGRANRISRGGSFSLEASRARSSCRSNDSPSFAALTLGVRPGRSLSR